MHQEQQSMNDQRVNPMDSLCQQQSQQQQFLVSNVSNRMKSNMSPFSVTGSPVSSSTLSSVSSSTSSSCHPDSSPIMTKISHPPPSSCCSSASHAGPSRLDHPEPPPRPSKKSHPNGSCQSASMINSQAVSSETRSGNFLHSSSIPPSLPPSSSTPKSFMSQSQYSLSQNSSSSYFLEDDNWYSQLFLNGTPSSTPVFPSGPHHLHLHASSTNNTRSLHPVNNNNNARKVKRSSTFNSDDLAVQTPSPSDSGIAELEGILREKDAEITFLRETLEQNEQVGYLLLFFSFPFSLPSSSWRWDLPLH